MIKRSVGIPIIMPLLQLPLEIRYIIYEFALYVFQPLPESPACAGKRVRLSHCSHEYHECRCQTGDIFVNFEFRAVKDAQCLFQVNHQIYREVRSLLGQRGFLYVVDVMVVNERELWPTWIAAPVCFYRVDHAQVSFRFFGKYDSNNGASRLLDMLPHFLVYITLCWPEWFQRYNPLKINKLTLDFRTPNDDPERLAPRTLEASDWIWGRMGAGSGPSVEAETGLTGLMRPEWLAREMSRVVEQGLQMTYLDGTLGNTMHRRLGTVDIRVDGDLQNTFSAADILQRMRYADAICTPLYILPGDRFMAYLRWKKSVLEDRGANGLQVLYPDEPELYSGLSWQKLPSSVSRRLG